MQICPQYGILTAHINACLQCLLWRLRQTREETHGQIYFENNLTREIMLYTPAVSPLSFALHFHPEAEFYRLYSGRAWVTVDGNVYALRPGDMVFCMPGQVHGYTRAADARLSFVRVRLPDETGAPVRMRCPLLLCPGDALYTRLDHYYREMAAGYATGEPGPACAIMAQALCMAALLLRCGNTDPVFANSASEDELRRRVTGYISSCYTHSVTLEETARACTLSVSSLAHRFRRLMGCPFPDYVGAFRLHHALQLLITTDLPLSEVALARGFGSLRSMDRLFREKTGQSPRHFRSAATAGRYMETTPS